MICPASLPIDVEPAADAAIPQEAAEAVAALLLQAVEQEEVP